MSNMKSEIEGIFRGKVDKSLLPPLAKMHVPKHYREAYKAQNSFSEEELNNLVDFISGKFILDINDHENSRRVLRAVDVTVIAFRKLYPVNIESCDLNSLTHHHLLLFDLL